MKTLGICIPTYRRPAMLERCIRTAIESAVGRPIRIFVADDSVSDANVDTLTRLCALHPCIEWKRNAVNEGIDRNIQLALAMNHCDYGWLIGEDDRFLPGAVARIETLIQHCDEPFIFANYQFVTEDHGRVLKIALSPKGPPEDTVGEFIAESLWATGFIGCCIVERDAWARIDGRQFDGTYFTHVGRILGLISENERVPLVREPCIANRSQGEDTFTWKHDAFGVFLGYERMCALAAAQWPRLSEPLARAVVNYRTKFTYFSVKSTFRLRSEGAFDLRQFHAYVKRSPLEPWRKLWMLGLALTPRALLKPFARAYVLYQRRQAESTGAAP